MCKDCATVNSFHKRLAKVTEEEVGLPELINRLDGLISKYVRFSAPINDRHEIECYTCGDWRPRTVMDAGHFVSRECMYLRFDVSRNIRPQCHICNRAKYGMAEAFRTRLEKDLPGIVDILLQESHIVHKWGRDELKQMILEYEQKTKNLK